MLNKNLIILFMMNLTTNIFSTWINIFPYLASYNVRYNPDITIVFYFNMTILILLGQSISSSILPFSFFLFGIKGSLILIALIHVLITYFLTYSASFAWIVFSTFMTGIYFQGVTFVTNIYLKLMYEEKSKKLIGLAMTGSMIGPAIWILIMNHTINPDNRQADHNIMINGNEEKFFDFEVTKNVNHYLSINALFTFIIAIICYFLLDKVPGYPCRALIWIIDVLCARNDSEIDSSSFAEITFSITRSKANITSDSYSREESFSDSEVELEEIPETNENKEALIDKKEDDIKEKKYINLWLLYATYFLIYLVNVYLIDNSTVIGLYLVNDNNYINKSLSFATVAGIISNSFSPLIWEKLGFIKSIIYLVIANYLLLILLLFFSSYALFFVLFSFIVRFSLNSIRLFIYFSLFDHFNSETVVKLSKYFDSIFVLSFVVAVVFNDIFVKNGDYNKMGVVLCIVLLVSLFLTFILKKQRDKYN